MKLKSENPISPSLMSSVIFLRFLGRPKSNFLIKLQWIPTKNRRNFKKHLYNDKV